MEPGRFGGDGAAGGARGPAGVQAGHGRWEGGGEDWGGRHLELGVRSGRLLGPLG